MDILKFLVYRKVELPGGSGELVAAFASREDAEAFAGTRYYVVER